MFQGGQLDRSRWLITSWPILRHGCRAKYFAQVPFSTVLLQTNSLPLRFYAGSVLQSSSRALAFLCSGHQKKGSPWPCRCGLLLSAVHIASAWRRSGVLHCCAPLTDTSSESYQKRHGNPSLGLLCEPTIFKRGARYLAPVLGTEV